MAFQVYLTDGINSAELDVENVDMKSVFAVADIKDISARKDNAKSIQFTGTKNNNRIFGYYFDFARISVLDIDSAIGFNYNPLKSVTALVYEESRLIFKGNIKVKQISVKGGVIIYDTFITGSFIDFAVVIKDKLLSDLDFSDLRHRYSFNNISNSWSGSTERYNSATSAYTTTAFSFGDGYVYPNIDYGYYSGATSVNTINLRNFKPAIYLTEYMDKLFNQDGLSGFSYEIKASDDFKTMFNHLVIPDSQEGNSAQYNGFVTSYSKPSNIEVTESGLLYKPFSKDGYRLVPISSIVQPPSTIIGNLLTTYSSYNDVLTVKRNFTSDGNLSIEFDYLKNQRTSPITVILELVKRSEKNNNDQFDDWAVVTDYKIPMVGNQSSYSVVFKFDIGSTNYIAGEQLAVRIHVHTDTGVFLGNSTFFRINKCVLSIPKTTSSYLKADILPSFATGDVITPQPPVNIKQSDFLKGVVNLFNFYVYTKPENYKHIIFEKFDDYYAQCDIQYLKTFGIDWSNKIDYKDGFTIKTNVDLPKSYLFQFKDDNDYLTDNYKKKFNSSYGSLTFSDSKGLLEQKKVELVFSPTIVTQENGTDRKYPLLYKVDGNVKKLSNTNIRLAYYNGLQPCKEYSIINIETTGGTAVTYFTGNTYPQVSNYYLSGNTVVNDIHFGLPYELYFPADSKYLNAATSYSNYYINQITELTNPNLFVVECKAWLNEIDISNLDLKVPIYIQTGDYNAAYFKVLSVEYQNNETPSVITLQRIAA